MQSRVLSYGGEWSWSRLLPPWPMAVFVCALYPALTQPLHLLNDPDTYLHIAAGSWILDHHALPTRDPFSHSMPGAAWVPHEWLAEVLLAAAYGLAGWNAVILLPVACFALAMGLLARFGLRHFDLLPGLILIVASAALLIPHLLARPHILALPCIVLWAGGLFAARDAGRAPPLWLLPVLCLWANLHGSFMAGLVLAGFCAVEAALLAEDSAQRALELRRWGVFLGLALAAALVTPNHVHGLVQPFRLLAMPTLQATFAEWQSPALASFPGLALWVLGLPAAALACALRLPPLRLVLLLGLLYATLQHGRHADLLATYAPLAIAAPLAPQVRQRLGATAVLSPAGNPYALGNLIAAAAALVVCSAIAVRPTTRPDGPTTPASALAAARDQHLSGPVFNNEGFGGYLIFEGVPVMIDGRIEMYGDDFLARHFEALQGDADVLTTTLDRYHIGWTLLRPDDGATALLDRLQGWRRVYADDQAVVHARSADARQ